MRLALLISSLGPGGAERVMSLLADALVARGHDVWLVTLAPAGRDFFSVDPRVRRIGLGLLGDSSGLIDALRANARRLRALRRALSGVQPDAVLSFGTPTNILAILACAGKRWRLVVSERIDPASHRELRLWAFLRAVLYHCPDAIVVQTESAARWFRKRLGKRPPVAVIPNPVLEPADARQPAVRVPKPYLLAAGRLVHQKGFDVLIRAFALIAQDLARLQLVIAGTGPAAPELRDLATNLGLANRVLLPGNVEDLPALMREAECFILSSRYEGFPNVLLEALASGVPVIATDCPQGPREILREGEFGLLVPREDPAALAAALVRLTTNAELRQNLCARAPLAIAPYAVVRVVGQWESVLRHAHAASW